MMSINLKVLQIDAKTLEIIFIIVILYQRIFFIKRKD